MKITEISEEKEVGPDYTRLIYKSNLFDDMTIEMNVYPNEYEVTINRGRNRVSCMYFDSQHRLAPQGRIFVGSRIISIYPDESPEAKPNNLVFRWNNGVNGWPSRPSELYCPTVRDKIEMALGYRAISLVQSKEIDGMIHYGDCLLFMGRTYPIKRTGISKVDGANKPAPRHNLYVKYRDNDTRKNLSVQQVAQRMRRFVEREEARGNILYSFAGPGIELDFNKFGVYKFVEGQVFDTQQRMYYKNIGSASHRKYFIDVNNAIGYLCFKRGIMKPGSTAIPGATKMAPHFNKLSKEDQEKLKKGFVPLADMMDAEYTLSLTPFEGYV